MQLSIADIVAIEKTRSLIECGIFQRISINELCIVANLGRSKLLQGFNFLYQTTIYQYHLTVSMEYAKLLLQDGKQVKEVSLLLGYKGSGHFSRAFTKVFDCKPSECKHPDHL